MIRQFGMALMILLAASCGNALADDGQKVSGVVELFTSQGCNSCPPADKILNDMAREGRVIALGYHVDYWDYLGWKDTLGSPEFTERQYGYANSFQTRTVYTPQMVINGRAHVNGGDRRSIDRHVETMAASGEGLTVDIAVEMTGNSVIIRTDGGNGDNRDAHLVLVYFDAARDVKIERGENRGRTITYANIVTGVQTAGMWHGEAARFELPKNEISKRGSGGCAILLQVVAADGSPGAIIGATMLKNDRHG